MTENALSLQSGGRRSLKMSRCQGSSKMWNHHWRTGIDIRRPERWGWDGITSFSFSFLIFPCGILVEMQGPSQLVSDFTNSPTAPRSTLTLTVGLRWTGSQRKEQALPQDTVMCQPILVVLHCKLILTWRTVQNLQDIVLSPLAEVTAQGVAWVKHVLNSYHQLFSVRGLRSLSEAQHWSLQLRWLSPLLSLPMLGL